jgi:tRNA pseudouridine55 synthase
VLLLDKPVRISSNHALQAVKRLFRADKAGHAGTLDPLASGLLPVLLGEATRFSGYLLDAPKRYEAEIHLGVTTTTADAEGDVIERKAVSVGRVEIAAVIARFLGTQTQVPPMYSALKRDGTPLYVLARRGETVERAPRSIEIHSLELLSLEEDRLVVRVACSKGTYIRTLAEDIGAALGCGAHLSALRRTATGAFDLAQATTLDALAAMVEEGRDALLRPADEILGQLPRVELDEPAEARFCHGQPIPMGTVPAGVCRVYGANGRFLGLAEERGQGWLAAKRLLGERKAEDSPTG